ncbi:MAG: transposase, partial [SAR324 cluster bacterium]|nr:transposase [SAR324 cluster bacterium]
MTKFLPSSTPAICFQYSHHAENLFQVRSFFGADPAKWHPHLHVLTTDGLFSDTGTFYVMKDVDLKPLEELFRAQVFKMLKKEGKITNQIINKLSTWKHSGFSVDNGVRIKKDD